MKNKIVLIGMRGSGKSHFASCLSQIFSWPKIDMDDEIELHAKKTIPSVVKTEGWESFRDMEFQMAKKVSKLQNVIISTGGGAITFERNQKFLKNEETVVVFLFSSYKKLCARLKKSMGSRPQLEKGVEIEAELKKTWMERKDIYFSMADIVFEAQDGLHKHPRKNVEENAKVLAEKIREYLD